MNTWSTNFLSPFLPHKAHLPPPPSSSLVNALPTYQAFFFYYSFVICLFFLCDTMAVLSSADSFFSCLVQSLLLFFFFFFTSFYIIFTLSRQFFLSLFKLRTVCFFLLSPFPVFLSFFKLISYSYHSIFLSLVSSFLSFFLSTYKALSHLFRKPPLCQLTISLNNAFGSLETIFCAYSISLAFISLLPIYFSIPFLPLPDFFPQYFCFPNFSFLPNVLSTLDVQYTCLPLSLQSALISSYNHPADIHFSVFLFLMIVFFLSPLNILSFPLSQSLYPCAHTDTHFIAVIR